MQAKFSKRWSNQNPKRKDRSSSIPDSHSQNWSLEQRDNQRLPSDG